ncbi:sporulation integral membrane protein YtvI [Virgibacillus kekensis]|uniref:Sporulation integral membrane protein YtvI n=1 Tax=Virgibacillus kekensis TaxID=202261 RepID=A0ABV9DE39_9BACI
MYKHRIDQLLRLLVVLFSVIFIYLIMYFTVPSIYPFLIAVLLSLFLNPSVTFLEEKLKMPRLLATIVIILILLTAVVSFIIFLVAELIQGTTYLAENLPAHFKIIVRVVENFIDAEILPVYEKITSFFHTLSPGQQETVSENLKLLINQTAETGTDFLRDMLMQIPQTLTLLPGSFTTSIFVLLATVIITKDWNVYVNTMKKITPASVHQIGISVWVHLQNAMFGFIKAQLILITISACIIFVGLTVLQIKHAMTIALIAALVDILPLIGTGIIFIPWVLYLFLTGDYPLTISITVLYMLVVIQRQFLEPKIVSSNIGLNPLAALVALFAGIQIWGVLGLFLGPLLLIICNAFYRAGVFNQILKFVKGT